MADKVEAVSKGLRRPKQSSSNGVVADWCVCDAKLLQKLIDTASNKGAALRFGFTRDCGAFSIGIYYGDERWTDYVRPGEDIDAYLADLLEVFEEAEPQPQERGKQAKKR